MAINYIRCKVRCLEDRFFPLGWGQKLKVQVKLFDTTIGKLSKIWAKRRPPDAIYWSTTERLPHQNSRSESDESQSQVEAFASQRDELMISCWIENGFKEPTLLLSILFGDAFYKSIRCCWVWHICQISGWWVFD